MIVTWYSLASKLIAVVMMQGGHEERITPGATLAHQADKPFTGLTAFGTGFMSKFEGSQLPHEVKL